MGAFHLTTADWIVIAVIGVFILMGVRSGLLAGFLSLVGFLAGAILASRLAPSLLSGGDRSAYAPLVTLIGAVVGGMAIAMVLERVGAGLKAVLPVPFLGSLDRAAGAIFGLVVGLAVAWLGLLVAVSLPAPDGVRHAMTKSKVLSGLGAVMPPADEVLGAIARFDPLPVVGGPSPELLAVPRSDASTAAVAESARNSIVRVRAASCGLAIEGSGWVAGPDLVVTNAHVVAGDDSPIVERRGAAPGLDAKVATFDRRNDIAVLSVPGLGLPALDTSEPQAGEGGVVAGFPLDGGFRSFAVTIGRTATVFGDDAYGRGPVTRRVESIRGRVRPGNSGGPVLDRFGRSVGTVYGRTEAGRPSGGFAVPTDVVQSELRRARSGQRDPTGPCSP